ncbi:MAG: DUF2892 domain-containing protein [Alicyclobacillus herbarius]|uniref:YgaP family membrane protein n=1 Tax=Alicyclobacillus herbarius TaxID=122960 RepID=UPI00040FD8A2|nr:DUF2892 domain-containing protein [Alicyclobacillus herbarius]MCL6631716.1 DUF2892 domain-containing protein [Alicyclobacillus herbarius]
MKSNISTADRYLRLVAGLMAYGGASKMRKGGLGKGLLMAFGAMKVAEGITGWCPLTAIAEQVNRLTPTDGPPVTKARDRIHTGHERRQDERRSSGQSRDKHNEEESHESERGHSSRKGAAEPMPDHTHTDEDV